MKVTKVSLFGTEPPRVPDNASWALTPCPLSLILSYRNAAMLSDALLSSLARHLTGRGGANPASPSRLVRASTEIQIEINRAGPLKTKQGGGGGGVRG